ncbi:MAG: DNA adenine methylase [Pirellulales bacterium]|nr:DNA adenine methylase [Pirellulales bacterium]
MHEEGWNPHNTPPATPERESQGGIIRPFRSQLLKWIGNKQRFAHEIISHFPGGFQTYHEPFLGSGAVLGTLAPQRALASDAFTPLIEIWQTLRNDPGKLKRWYQERWAMIGRHGKATAYEQVKAAYNARPNGADLLFLCRACYGGVMRFRKEDGHMSTPCGPHQPIAPESFAQRVETWSQRTMGAQFDVLDFQAAMGRAGREDLIYCDPPYRHSQSILYGAQAFSLQRLFEAIADCKRRGAFVALSIDGSKKSGDVLCDVQIPPGLFQREALVNCGRSMLRRFQMNGRTLEKEIVTDRLLLTY